MSDGATGSAILVGNPASDGAAGNAGAAAPAPSNTPAGNDPAPAPAPGTGNWYDSIQDAELKGYAQNKGWKDPVEVLNGYKNLEKLVGQDKIPMPKGAEDKEGWSRVYDALGRPKTAEDYKLPVPEGDTGEFAKVAAGKFHELGLTASQAQGLAEWWNQTQGGQLEQMQQQSAQKSEADLQGLRQEWGKAYDENIELGRRAAREYGLDATKLSAIENALGTGEMIKLMAKIGRAQGEMSFETGDTNKASGGFGMTPAAAQQRISALQQDKDWTAKYLSNNADAVAEMKRLMSLAYPE
jgi:hypothetical protein